MKLQFAAGDTAILTGVNMHGIQKVIVKRVGRTNVYVEWGEREKAFDATDGSEKGNYSHYRIRTEAQYAADVHRSELVEALRKHGIGIDHYRCRPPNDTLEKLLAVLDTADPDTGIDNPSSSVTR